MEITPEQLKETIKQAIEETKPKATLTIDECTDFSGIGRNKLLELVHKEKSDFPCFKVGTKFLINREMFISWLDKITIEKRVI
ncbi:MAG: DNA-binding protein excisionase family [Clostridiaceae bacterium]|jgi:excisionase family DNA binding protein|nr:DNA-binding protein excisionase family [Clostridiaceae bacterium]